MGVLEELGVVKDLRDEGDGSDVTHVGGFGGAGAAGQDPTGVAEDVGDARLGVPFGGERVRMPVGGNDQPLPRLLVLGGKIVAGVTRNVVRLADGRTSLGAILEGD